MKKEVKKNKNNFIEFYKKYKLYIYIGLVLFIICLLNLIFYRPETKFHKYMNIDNAFSVETVETEDYSFLDSYDVHKKIYKYNDKVLLGKYSGDLYFVRGVNNLNIYLKNKNERSYIYILTDSTLKNVFWIFLMIFTIIFYNKCCEIVFFLI